MRLRFVSPVLMWIIILVGGALLLWLLPGTMLFARQLWLTALAVLYWAVFFIWSVRVHSQAPQSAAAISHLVTDGPYRLVRHPIYSADIALMIGIFFGFPRLDVLCGALWGILVFLLWMHLEERALLQKFGVAYEQYHRRTPMVLPWKIMIKKKD